ncbi:PIN/TRAM domain-containing protein [Clostridium sp. AL.422]|uniref:PIN/TRAM domain-containing protein n=1 Tax=Clostridium TaxID=1485 RepID=UPI00293DC67E|nr:MULTISPECIES: PIN/TRAM domain-containing protein [unclassified Clostridium]MDV4152246.1 PIN/TRAM domain-containing protein [Clostridium sp. AL.422]
MLKKIIRVIFTIIGFISGYIISGVLINIQLISNISFLSESIGIISFRILLTLLIGIILYFISPSIYDSVLKAIEYIEKYIQRFTATEIIYGVVGAVISLIITSLIGLPLNSIDLFGLGPILFMLLNLIFAIIFASIFIEKKDDISNVLVNLKKNSIKEKKSKVAIKSHPKVLDTSVIIDGRIFDICQTGFIEGPLVIPNFVLDELRHISDSADSLKRNRGRRGLDILNKIQKELEIETQIWEGDFPEIQEVDSKLLKLAQVLKGKVITNDFNLNKVAEFQGVPVLNINELANAIKPIVLPGEEMHVVVVKDGKEATQGIGYLDDGTMIVVEGGRKHMGEQITVIVTSVLQTAAGRMIFAKPKDE